MTCSSPFLFSFRLPAGKLHSWQPTDRKKELGKSSCFFVDGKGSKITQRNAFFKESPFWAVSPKREFFSKTAVFEDENAQFRQKVALKKSEKMPFLFLVGLDHETKKAFFHFFFGRKTRLFLKKRKKRGYAPLEIYS